MTEELMKIVQRFRLAIYAIAILCVIWISSLNFASQICPIDTAETVAFWPPDLVPHPMPPWEYPVDPNDLPPMSVKISRSTR